MARTVPRDSRQAVAGHPEVREHVRGESVRHGEQSEKRVFGADVVVAELACLLAGVVEHLVGGGRPAARPAALHGGRRAVALLGRLLAGAELLTDLRP